jgi:hypothetical protein
LAHPSTKLCGGSYFGPYTGFSSICQSLTFLAFDCFLCTENVFSSRGDGCAIGPAGGIAALNVLPLFALLCLIFGSHLPKRNLSCDVNTKLNNVATNWAPGITERLLLYQKSLLP